MTKRKLARTQQPKTRKRRRHLPPIWPANPYSRSKYDPATEDKKRAQFDALIAHHGYKQDI